MKKDIHKNTKDVVFKCSCGETVTLKSTLKNDVEHIEICSKCHPYYTGKQGSATLTGNVEKFNKKYNLNNN